MGTVDIEQFVEELTCDDSIFFDDEKYTYDEYLRIVTECVTKEADEEYKRNDGEIDDWDLFEYNCRYACNKALGNLE